MDGDDQFWRNGMNLLCKKDDCLAQCVSGSFFLVFERLKTKLDQIKPNIIKLKTKWASCTHTDKQEPSLLSYIKRFVVQA